MRRGSLCNLRGRGQFSAFENTDDLVVVFQLAGIEGLQVASAPHFLHCEIFYISNVKGLWLSHHSLRGGIRIEGSHLQRKAKVLFNLLSNIVDIRNASAELAQCHVLDIVRHNHWESGNKTRSGREAPCGGGTFNKLPAPYAFVR